MSSQAHGSDAHAQLRKMVSIIDRMLPPDEANALTHFHEVIVAYVVAALSEGLSLSDIRRDIDDHRDLWGFGPWGVLLEDGRLFLIANASVDVNSDW